MSPNTIPTWGYHPKEPARIFHLSEGESLPEGWADTPAAFVKDATSDDRSDAVRLKGADAATAGKPRNVPPAYRGKPEGALWLEGYDSVQK